MATGIVKRLVREKGFWFILSDGGGAELFFHRSSVSGSVSFDALQEGRRVSYTETTSQKGLRAEDVRAV